MYKNTDNIHTHVHTALHDVSHCRKKKPGLTEDPGPALLLGSRLGKKMAGQGTIQAVDSIWLVVYLPLWKIWKSVGMMTFPIYGKIKFMFQTTNQVCDCISWSPWCIPDKTGSGADKNLIYWLGDA